MQNIGFTYALLPGLKTIIPQRFTEVIHRYSAFFNTQPYMAPTAAGVFLHLHEQGEEELIERIKPSLSGSLAAIGDTFFWATLKPLLALSLLISVLTEQFWGLTVAVLLYNSVHLWTMSWGLLEGYKHGPEGAFSLGRILSVTLSKNLTLMIPFLCGALVILVSQRIGPGIDLIVGLVLFAASTVLIKLRVNIFWLVYGVFTLSMLWTILQ